MESFSERYNYIHNPEDHLVYEDAPEQLREYIKKVVYQDMERGPSFLRSVICSTLLVRENPQNWSEYPNIAGEVDYLLYDMQWYQVYDVIESLSKAFDGIERFGRRSFSRDFEDLMNNGFMRLGIGWQLQDGVLIVRNETSFEQTVRAAEVALNESGFSNAHRELKEAIDDLSKRPEADLTGCVQHAMGALESVARELTGEHSRTLGDILKRHSDLVPRPLDESLTKLWGYASEFARHIREDRRIARKEATLVLGISAAIVTYLIEGIE